MTATLFALALGQYEAFTGDQSQFELFGIAVTFFSLAVVAVALTRASASVPRLGLLR